jgi:hypothetical protein
VNPPLSIRSKAYWSLFFGSAHPTVTWSFQYFHGATHLPVHSPKHRQQLPHLVDAVNAAFGWLNAMNENEDPLAELAAAAAAPGVSLGPAAAPYQPQPPLVHEAEAVALVYAIRKLVAVFTRKVQQTRTRAAPGSPATSHCCTMLICIDSGTGRKDAVSLSLLGGFSSCLSEARGENLKQFVRQLFCGSSVATGAARAYLDGSPIYRGGEITTVVRPAELFRLLLVLRQRLAFTEQDLQRAVARYMQTIPGGAQGMKERLMAEASARDMALNIHNAGRTAFEGGASDGHLGPFAGVPGNVFSDAADQVARVLSTRPEAGLAAALATAGGPVSTTTGPPCAGAQVLAGTSAPALPALPNTASSAIVRTSALVPPGSACNVAQPTATCIGSNPLSAYSACRLLPQAATGNAQQQGLANTRSTVRQHQVPAADQTLLAGAQILLALWLAHMQAAPCHRGLNRHRGRVDVEASWQWLVLPLWLSGRSLAAQSVVPKLLTQ